MSEASANRKKYHPAFPLVEMTAVAAFMLAP
jgi:hypothetical protein